MNEVYLIGEMRESRYIMRIRYEGRNENLKERFAIIDNIKANEMIVIESLCKYFFYDNPNKYYIKGNDDENNTNVLYMEVNDYDHYKELKTQYLRFKRRLNRK